MMEDAQDLAALARAIVEHLPVDWKTALAESSGDAEQRDIVHQLEVIAGIAAVHRATERSINPEKTWGPFRIFERIGHGSFGDVYRALDTRLEREVALKLLRQADTPREIESTAMDEARLLASVQHPNVVTIHGADRIDGRVGFWMDFIRGRTLDQLLQESGPLPPVEIARVCVDVCRALGAVHDAGLLHRDIKAQNVMQDGSGRNILMDFGAGRAASEFGDFDLTGSPLYIAPEVLSGEPASKQSDIYSVGVLLFRLATGKYPVEGRTIEELRAHHAAGNRADIRVLRPDCPAGTSALIERALSGRASNRFETAASMADAAARIIDGAQPVRKRLSHGKSVALSMLAVGILSSAWFIGRPAFTDSGVRTRLLWDDATDLGGTATADGRLLSFADWETGNLAVRDLVSGRTTRITKDGYPTGEVEHSAFSPDGKWIAYSWLDESSADRAVYELRVISIDGTHDRTLRRGDAERTYWEPQAWSPEGKWIVALVASKHGWMIELVSREGMMRTLTTLGSDGPTTIRVSPDERWVAFHQQKQRTVSIVPFDGSQSTPTRIPDADRLLAWTGDGRLLFARDRNGSSEVYELPMKDGRAAGKPVRLDGVADMGQPLGVTASGSLLYGKTKSSADALALTIDPYTGTIGPERVTQSVTLYGMSGGGVRYSPDGAHVLYTPTQGTILIRSLDGRNRTLVPQLQRVGRVEWSGDGRSLIVEGTYEPGERGIYRVDLDTGAPALMVATRPHPTAHVMSPDGRTLYTASGFFPDVAVVARDLRTGVERHIRDQKEGVFGLRVTPDGRALAIVTFPVVEVVDLSNGQTTLSVGAPKDARFSDLDWSPDGRYLFAPVSYGNVHRRGELWRIPADGSAPELHALSTAVSGASMRPDGRELSVVRSEDRQQVWIVENLLPPGKASSH